MSDPSPALRTLFRRFHQMCVGPLRNHGNDSRHSQLCQLLDRPFESVELKDRQRDRDLARRSRSGDRLTERKAHATVAQFSDRPQSHLAGVRKFKCLADLRTQDLRQMPRVRPGDRRAIPAPLIRDPASPTHAAILATWGRGTAHLPKEKRMNSAFIRSST